MCPVTEMVPPEVMVTPEPSGIAAPELGPESPVGVVDVGLLLIFPVT